MLLPAFRVYARKMNIDSEVSSIPPGYTACIREKNKHYPNYLGCKNILEYDREYRGYSKTITT